MVLTIQDTENVMYTSIELSNRGKHPNRKDMRITSPIDIGT